MTEFPEEAPNSTLAWCFAHQQHHPRSAFSVARRRPSGIAPSCKDAVHLAYRNKGGRLRQRMRLVKLQYGLSWKEFLGLWEGQNGLCSICQCPLTLGAGPHKSKSTVAHVDHSHSSGRVRGLLCAGCNRGLGNFKDSVSLLLRAVDYLEQNA